MLFVKLSTFNIMLLSSQHVSYQKSVALHRITKHGALSLPLTSCPVSHPLSPVEKWLLRARARFSSPHLVISAVQNADCDEETRRRHICFRTAPRSWKRMTPFLVALPVANFSLDKVPLWAAVLKITFIYCSLWGWLNRAAECRSFSGRGQRERTKELCFSVLSLSSTLDGVCSHRKGFIMCEWKKDLP